MKKIAFLLIACTALAYCADRYITSKKQDDLRKEAQAAQFEKNRSIVRELVARYSANYKWYQEFYRDRDVLRSQLMQANLEDQWIVENPIIFIGTIDDYRNTNDGNYQVTIKPDIFSICITIYDVGLDVIAPKELIKNLAKAHPEALSGTLSSLDGNVVIVAKISSVEKRFEGTGENAGEFRYGVGEILDIKFLKGGVRCNKNINILGESDGS